jgi:3'-phosphoadenosine 5'-phosphosulfate sulfotransferase (PAPS reductase)/FAD synthetase
METLSSETKALLRDRKVIASVSGGKDSAAMSLWLTENGIEHERVFCDTGWEHPDTYRYLDEVLEPKLGRIERLKPERDFVQLVVHKGMFPSRTRRFCTSELKVKPLARYLNARMDADGDLVNAVGIRAGESAARAKMPAWEWQESFDCEVWRPLLSWSEEDVIACHTRHGLRPNPLYLRGRGVSRVGCWPCLFVRKDELRHLAEVDPGRIDQIRELEEKVQATAEARYAKRGETFESLGYLRPAFFQARTGGGGEMWPIDKAVAWSRTSHGGQQVELFASGEGDAGCMRWGLCDTGIAPGDPEERP